MRIPFVVLGVKNFLVFLTFPYLEPVPTKLCDFYWLQLRITCKSGWIHPRRPRGSQSGWEERRDESFQVRAKEPLGTDSHRTISKNSSGCRLLIGHKKCFVLLCPMGEQFLLSSFREFGKLENFRPAFSPDPTDCPWVSEDGLYCASRKKILRQQRREK